MDTSPQPINISRHNAEIHENRRHWERKPLLREVYRCFYREIAKALEFVPPGDILECGSGIGNIKSVLPNAITSDLFPNPWLDRIENVYALSYPDKSLSAVVLFDVFHHLQYPGTALSEINRVLKKDGKLIIFEPSMGIIGRFVLGAFHHEPLALDKKITWQAPKQFSAIKMEYYAAQGNAWRIFSGEVYQKKCVPPTLLYIKYFPALSWIMTGGFRGTALCGLPCKKILYFLDIILTITAKFWSSRMLIVLIAK
jgi:SAM-dependent methyltransferase